MISYHICLVFSKIIPVAFAPPEHVSLDKSLIEIKKGFFLKKMFKGEYMFYLKVKLRFVPKHLVRL